MKNSEIYHNVMQYVISVTDKEFAGLSVSTLATDFDICRFKLTRQFKINADMTLENFLFKQRMTRAASLLMQHKDITVKQVATRIGFSSSDYFIRKFKEYYGMRPGIYKRGKNDHLLN